MKNRRRLNKDKLDTIALKQKVVGIHMENNERIKSDQETLCTTILD